VRHMRKSTSEILAPIFLLFLLVAAWPVLAQQPRPVDSELVRWSTVEIVTNDFNSVEKLREATGITPGSILAMGDPRVRQACDLIKRELPAKSVRCTTLTPAKVNEYVQAELIVEIGNYDELQPPVLPDCLSKYLAPDLIALRNEWGRELSVTLGWGSTERVNASHYLDYGPPTLHQLATRIHSTVSSRMEELERATASCNSVSRAYALYLMNFTGFPERVIRSASARMTDPDPDVRNAATRLLGVFNGFILKNQVAGIVKSACATTVSGGFTDRNKSLVLLDRIRLRGLVSFGALDATCRKQIRNIARTSSAPQTGRAAQALMGLVDSKTPK
jgi:hypothetical protein